MSEEVVIERGNGGMTCEDLKALIEARCQGIVERAATTPREELAEPLFWWDIFGIGPYQAGATTVPPADLVDQPLLPHRIIQVGEKACICTVVIVNPFFPDPSLSACDILTGFDAKIEVNYITSNLQTMTPVPELSASSCIHLKRNVCCYVDCFEFTPRTPACLYEMNICARVCNCSYKPIQPFGAFVKWVLDLDYDVIFGSRTLGFDRPVRFMVSDFKTDCEACK